MSLEGKIRRSRADYERCAREGLTRAETAAVLGVSSSAVYKAVQRHGLRFAASDIGRPMQAARSLSAPSKGPAAPRGFSVSPDAIRRALEKQRRV